MNGEERSQTACSNCLIKMVCPDRFTKPNACSQYQPAEKEPTKEQDIVTKLRQVAMDCYDKINNIPLDGVADTVGYSEFVSSVKKFARAELQDNKERGEGEIDREIVNMACSNCVNNNMRLIPLEKERYCKSCNLKDMLDTLYEKKYSAKFAKEKRVMLERYLELINNDDGDELDGEGKRIDFEVYLKKELEELAEGK